MPKIRTSAFFFCTIALVLILISISGCNEKIKTQDAINDFENNPDQNRNWSIINFTPEFKSVDGTDVYYYFPPNAKGVIFFFHGSGGNASSWFSRVEGLYFIKASVARGYGVVSTESKDRKNGDWNPTDSPSTNEDIKQWIATEDFLKKEGLLTSEMQRFGVGMSRGATFSAYTGGYLKYDGIALYNGRGFESEFEDTSYKIPTLFHISEQDIKQNQEFLTANYNTLKNRGVRTLLLEKKVEVLDKNRFMRIPNVTSEISELMFDNFVASGYFNQDGTDTGKLASTPSEERGGMYRDDKNVMFKDLPPEYLKNASDFKDQVALVLADHMFHAGYAEETLDFFEGK